ncbi:MAG: retroviral-like aspartic protease family protein [Candidatus Obscuribacterales bacterium]|nr:retroviral-like aspartic protease family protein [Candidatus Obscuribacterales bacterium]
MASKNYGRFRWLCLRLCLCLGLTTNVFAVAKNTGFTSLPTTQGSVSNSNGSVKKGIDLYNQGKYADAVRELTKAAATAPKNWKASCYYYLGCSYYQLSQKAQAIAYFKRVRGLYPDSPEAKSAMTMLTRLGQPGTGAVIGNMKTSSATASAGTNHPFASSSAASSASSNASATSPTSATESELSRLPNENRIYFTEGTNGHLLVKAYLNNRPIDCWFDTGASAHFGKNHLSQAGVPLPRGQANSSTSGWAGVKVDTWVQKMKLRMGNMEREVPVSVEEQMDLPPLVGQYFIQGYDYEIDHKGKFITMRKKNQATSSFRGQVSALYDVPCVSRHNREYVMVEINNHKEELLLDTGSNSTILSEDLAKKLRIDIPDNAETVSGSGVGGSVSFRIVYADLRMGPIWKRGFRVEVGGMGTNAIGQDFLQGYRYTIDKEKQLLRFFH